MLGGCEAHQPHCPQTGLTLDTGIDSEQTVKAVRPLVFALSVRQNFTP
jgi:hypothetical protein